MKNTIDDLFNNKNTPTPCRDGRYSYSEAGQYCRANEGTCFGTGAARKCRECKARYKSGGLDDILTGGGPDPDTDPDTNTDPDPDNSPDDGGPDTKTIMLWVGVAILLLVLIIGGAYAIKKIKQ